MELKISTDKSATIIQPQSTFEKLNIQFSSQIINVDQQLNATTIDEFIKQIEEIGIKEQANQTFVISSAHLETTLHNIRGEFFQIDFDNWLFGFGKYLNCFFNL
jgi:hypothetical protein